MFSSRTIRTIAIVLGLGVLLIVFAARLQAWQEQNAGQMGNVEALAISSEDTPAPLSTEIPSQTMATYTPFPLPMAVNEQGTPFNPIELTPNLTIPAVNPEGTPLTPTPSLEELADFTGTPRPMPTLTPGGSPTPTPPTYITRVDLAKGLPDSEIWRIVVLRADGNLDEYRVPAEQVRPLISDPTDINSYLAFRDTLFQLKPGDSVIYENFANAPVKAVPLGIPPVEHTVQVETPMPELTNEPVSPAQSEFPSHLHLPEINN